MVNVFSLKKGWGRICYVFADKGKHRCSLSDLRASIGVGLDGVLQFPIPSRKLLQ